MEAFLQRRGATICPAAAKYDASPARVAKDDSDSDWLSRRREEPENELSLLAKSKVLVMTRNLGGKPIELGIDREYLREEARRWFFERSDFGWWCEIAGFEPEYIQEKARKVFEEGIQEMPKSMTKEAQYSRAYAARKRREKGHPVPRPVVARSVSCELGESR